MEEKKLELQKLQQELEYIYKNTTRAYRQKAGMSKRLCYLYNRISKLENELKEVK